MQSPSKISLTRQLDLRLLELFDTIYRTSNLTLTGAKLGLSQPAVSRGLAKLRHIYDDPLFVRQPRGVYPTPFAEQLIDPIAHALGIIQGTVQKRHFNPLLDQRCFRIALSDIGERHFMPRLLCHLAEHAPHVTIQSLSQETSTFVEGMASGDIDFGIGFFPTLGKQFHVKRLFKERFTYIARNGHPSVHRESQLSDLKRLPHVIADPPGTEHASAVIKMLGGKRNKANVALEVRSYLSLAPIVAETDLVAVIPSFLANSAAKYLNLQCLQIPVALRGLDVDMVWHTRYSNEVSRVWFRKLFLELFHQ
jgi:DNA-binding transcriptional LysR family regulator